MNETTTSMEKKESNGPIIINGHQFSLLTNLVAHFQLEKPMVKKASKAHDKFPRSNQKLNVHRHSQWQSERDTLDTAQRRGSYDEKKNKELKKKN